MIFFVLIHMPLSRMHSSWCFVTALVPMALNLRTKFWFYEKANAFVCLFFGKDREAKNHVQLPKHLRYRSGVNLDTAPSDIILSKEEAALQESSAYAAVAILSLFFSLAFNFLYSLFLQEILTDSLEGIIRFFDRFQIEIHFIRYLYLALFETRGKFNLMADG